VKADLLRRLVEDRQKSRAVVMATNLDGGEQVLLYPLGGGTDAEHPLHHAAREALLNDRSQPVDGPDGRYFLQVHNPPHRMVVVGAVHVAQPLTQMAGLAGFHVALVDPREAFNTEDRFPDLDRLIEWPETALSGIKLDHRTAVVTLTHDPKLDDPALVTALGSPVFYIGALGSRKTHGRLHRMQRPVRRHSLNRRDLGPHRFDRKHRATLDQLATHVNDTSPALAGVTPDMSACEAQGLA